MYIVTKHGQKNIWNTTVGWQLLVQWRDQSEIPTSIGNGHRLDKENDNNFWRDANTTKIQNYGVAFEVLPEV